jgi:hypothetical protein
MRLGSYDGIPTVPVLDFRRSLLEAVSPLPRSPELIQMGCDLDRLVLTEEIISPLTIIA